MLYRSILTSGFLILIAFSSACSQLKTSTPISSISTLGTISPVNQIPEKTLKGAMHFEGYSFLFVHSDHASEFAAGLLVPVPFVTDAIVNSVKKRKSESLADVYAGVDPYEATVSQILSSVRYQEKNGEFSLYPAVIVEECIDSKYRLSLLFQLEKDEWMGRYYYHLPTTIPKTDIKAPTQVELQTFKDELTTGAGILVDLIDQSLSGGINTEKSKATVSSLYIVGGKFGGLASPNLFIMKDAQVIENADEHVVLRIPGDPKAPAKSGGMAYGVHYFYKDQLSRFDLQ